MPFGFVADAKKGAFRVAMYAVKSLERYKKQLDLDPHNIKPTLLTNEYRLVEDGTLPEGQLLRDGKYM